MRGNSLETGIEGKRFLMSNDTNLLFKGTGIFWILEIKSKKFLMEKGDSNWIKLESGPYVFSQFHETPEDIYIYIEWESF